MPSPGRALDTDGLSAQLGIVVGADRGHILHPGPSRVSHGEQPACHVGVPVTLPLC